MARISGVTLPHNKRVEVGLTLLFGIGLTRSQEILKTTGIDPNTRCKDLTLEDEQKIKECIDAKLYTIEGDLKREIIGNIKRLKDIGAYRGTRHARRLPARGQRTKTNTRTVRGNIRRTMGSGRKKSADKT
ncbi:MAG TPA: 30S ribosomal protein S13 [Candidatus Jacksonbacteria bacterium]|uniref:Small ribosomal subunit protein uS13 n=1 Tax=Candidatus Falkowbacteria bacterium GW2011_GWA2_41_14 TaxID=1618635 RepID=A0A0G0US52_9BACT|nr:MAG: Ribosomal protein S13 [Candidatus Falkowbacteria bacterium GW2011_GWA2_41_14]OGY69648.1 MAG: 30S ribosomal protein S13 [Candidatus Jacksonbacteria bacterium RIFCSPHIGHO2_02_FULL_43_10]OGY70926.1 MAG: 30S ribosomal protein S13 [Candidatus Jacksonbacteria bacterium RIFCSPLOWO2_01_FULL_44_13]HAZ16845.1 30S ribosomal protein S13 [Candidatus Jacksonbacteria bacterium]